MHESAQREAPNGVDVWRVGVQQQWLAFADPGEHLDAGERRRATAYSNEADRRRFVTSRGTLRSLLGHHLQIDPARLIFGHNEFGKPWLPDHPGLHFNTSHSGDWVLHALSRATRVGLDVEARRPDPLDLEDFGHVLAPPELDRLLSLPPQQRSAAFLDLWVCKEAYVKAVGEGLSRALRDICIGPIEGGGYELLDDRNPGGAGRVWRLQMIDLGPGYAGCLAHPGAPCRVCVRDYPAAGVSACRPR